MRWLTGLLALALAAPAAAADDWHVDALVGTDAPISVGLRGAVEGPLRLRGRLGVGVFPSPYLSLINDIGTSAGWYDEPTAMLIEAALKNSLLIEPHLGWRPVPGLGFHFGAGYTVAALGGDLSPVELLAVGLEQELPDEIDPALEVDMGATVHLLTAEVGWEFVIADKVVIDATLGGVFTMASKTTITADLEGRDRRGPGAGASAAEAALNGLAGEGEAYLDDIIQSYIHSPTVGIHAGYRFR